MSVKIEVRACLVQQLKRVGQRGSPGKAPKHQLPCASLKSCARPKRVVDDLKRQVTDHPNLLIKGLQQVFMPTCMWAARIKHILGQAGHEPNAIVCSAAVSACEKAAQRPDPQSPPWPDPPPRASVGHQRWAC